jgi:hypothetical protein
MVYIFAFELVGFAGNRVDEAAWMSRVYFLFVLFNAFQYQDLLSGKASRAFRPPEMTAGVGSCPISEQL